MLPCARPLVAICLLLMASSCLADSAIAVSNGTSVYDLLPQFGLPRGLLPDSVKDFSLSNDGSFVVELDKECYVQFDYLVYYDKEIKGTLHYGSITHLKGIQVKKLFLWLDVDEIKVDLPPSQSIYFQLGWITKKLDVSQFQTVHSCKDHSSQPFLETLCQATVPTREITMLITE